ncbi:MAG: hypothetical protein K1X44_05805 [Alphaproteobacteria bacterium]|nr:hypothetical protein [Alphaproteobacteria bacterium]
MLVGNDGNDILFGENDNDIIYGGKGQDLIFGVWGMILLKMMVVIITFMEKREMTR